MTDRVKGITIALDSDYRTDDVESIVNAILMVKGVAAVTKSHIVSSDDWINRVKIRMEMEQKILDVFRKDK